MKKRTIFLSVLLAAALFAGTAFAAGGDAGDPLVSLDFLQGIFAPAAEKAVGERLDAADKTVYDEAEARWRAAVAAAETAAGTEQTGVWEESFLKEADILSALTGTQVTLLEGEARASFGSGAVVDVTDGTELASGDALRVNHRYMVAEETAALFTVSSKTAILSYCGGYHLTLSDKPDYYAMGDALKSLTLLRGIGAGYGEGYALQKNTSRIEMLIMLIRLLGEEEDAKACTAPQPFSDIPNWCSRYVAYAYEKGYSNGIGGGKFGPAYPANPKMFVEVVRRALGYSTTGHTNIRDSLDRALEEGILTQGDYDALSAGKLPRAEVVYLSFYALDAPLHGSDRALHEKLEDGGVFTAADYRSAKALVTTERR